MIILYPAVYKNDPCCLLSLFLEYYGSTNCQCIYIIPHDREKFHKMYIHVCVHALLIHIHCLRLSTAACFLSLPIVREQTNVSVAAVVTVA